MRRACSATARPSASFDRARFAQAALRERVAFVLGVGEHERERELTQHGNAQVDVVVAVQAVERVAQERGAFGVFEIDGDAAAATADERERCLRGRARRVRCARASASADSRVDSAFARVSERALRASEPDERVRAVRRRRSRDRPRSRSGRARPTTRPGASARVTGLEQRARRVARRARAGGEIVVREQRRVGAARGERVAEPAVQPCAGECR